MSEETYGVLEIPFTTNPTENEKLRQLLSGYYSIYLAARKVTLRQMRYLRRNREYQRLLKLRRSWYLTKSMPNKKRQDSVKKRLSQITKDYSLNSKFSFTKLVYNHSAVKNAFPEGSSVIRQTIVQNIWDGVEKVMFTKAKKLGFTKFSNFTIATANANTPWRLDGRKFIVKISKKAPKSFRLTKLSDYANEVLTNNELRYFRIVQKQKKNHVDYALQITYKGAVPLNGRSIGNAVPTGLDIGPSSIAIYQAGKQVQLSVLFDKFDELNQKIEIIQTEMNWLDTLKNPDAFELTVNGKSKYIKGHKLQHTNHWYQLRNNLRHLYRLKSVYRKQRYEILANELMASSSTIAMEKVSISGWQAGLFGRSINNHAPALLMEILKRKMAYFNEQPFEINTNKAKLSQFHHDTGEFLKASLDQRDKTIEGHLVQRDLYSAYLAAFVSDDGYTLKSELTSYFDDFLQLQSEYVREFDKKEQLALTSFGINGNMILD